MVGQILLHLVYRVSVPDQALAYFRPCTLELALRTTTPADTAIILNTQCFWKTTTT